MSLDIDSIKIKVAELEAALNASLPGYANLLQVIHKELGAQPELLYKLDDAEIATIISGLGNFYKVEIIDPKNAKKDKKGISKVQGALLSEDDV